MHLETQEAVTSSNEVGAGDRSAAERI